MKPQVLLVDDEPALRFGVSHYLAQAGCAVEGSSTLREGWESLRSRCFDALILDLILPDGNGLDCIARLKEQQPGMAIIVVTAVQAPDVKREALSRGADHFFLKPVSLDELNACIQAAMAKKRPASQSAAPGTPTNADLR
jgi:DNA-binding response OmpR family regulator